MVKRKNKWWAKSWRRRDVKCQRCGKKIKMGRYCYWCGKRMGLW